jgi:uncharacterized membrane protein YkvA (DUF1232 family)
MSDNNKQDEELVSSGLIDKARRTLGSVPFVEQALSAYYCTCDPQTPARVKAILVGALAYFIMPIDVVPDFIAGLGFGDDAAVFWAAWNSVRAHIKGHHILAAKDKLADLRSDKDAA